MLYCLGRLRQLGARRAYVYPGDTNTAAMKLYESCGFRVVGIDRDWDRALEPAP